MSNLYVFLLNVFVNSFLMFITVVALIESIIFLFKIPAGRFSSLLRMVPILKLPFDLFSYDFSRWSYLKGINPLTAQEGTRTLSAVIGWPNDISQIFFVPITAGIQLFVDNMTFTVADVLSYFFDPIALSISCTIIVFISCCIFTKKIFEYLRFAHNMKETKRKVNKKIRNVFIDGFLRKNKAQVISSTLSSSPFVYGILSPQIYIPETLCKSLSKKEYEAVLAHENEHIRYNDNLIRLVLLLICSIFWWIPTKWLRKRIEEGQEIGCDSNCKSYGINPTTLATAIYKSAKCSLKEPKSEFTHALANHVIHKRVDLLLKRNHAKNGKVRSLIYCFTAMIAFFVIFLGRYWIF